MKIQLPKVENIKNSKTSDVQLLSSGSWGQSLPQNLSDIGCWVLLFGEPNKDRGVCWVGENASRQKISFSEVYGLYPSGSTIEIQNIAPGPGKKFFLVGFRKGSLSCEKTSWGADLNNSNYSEPLLVGTSLTNLQPGNNNVTISASLSLNEVPQKRVTRCDFETSSTPPSEINLQGPTEKILANYSSKLGQNFCHRFRLQIDGDDKGLSRANRSLQISSSNASLVTFSDENCATPSNQFPIDEVDQSANFYVKTTASSGNETLQLQIPSIGLTRTLVATSGTGGMAAFVKMSQFLLKIPEQSCQPLWGYIEDATGFAVGTTESFDLKLLTRNLSTDKTSNIINASTQHRFQANCDSSSPAITNVTGTLDRSFITFALKSGPGNLLRDLRVQAKNPMVASGFIPFLNPQPVGTQTDLGLIKPAPYFGSDCLPITATNKLNSLALPISGLDAQGEILSSPVFPVGFGGPPGVIQFYTDNACSAPVLAPLEIVSGSSSQTFFYRPNGIGMRSLTALSFSTEKWLTPLLNLNALWDPGVAFNALPTTSWWRWPWRIMSGDHTPIGNAVVTNLTDTLNSDFQPGSLLTEFGGDGAAQFYSDINDAGTRSTYLHRSGLSLSNFSASFLVKPDANFFGKRTLLSIDDSGGDDPQLQFVGMRATRVGVGNNHGCALDDTNPATTSGRVWCWGADGNGQQGNTTVNLPQTFAEPITTDFFKELAVGANHNCGITDAVSGNNVKCWGDRTYGQIGDGGSSGNMQDPYQITFRALKISAGQGHTCAIRESDGFPFCWGLNTSGQLGDNTTIQRNSPIQVSGFSYPTNEISAGATHSCLIKSTGHLYCWGNNLNGRLGDGTTTDRLTPVAIDAGTTYSKVSAGNASTCAITSSGVLKCWGLQTNGALGDGVTTATDQTSPVVIDSGVSYSLVKVNGQYGCGITTLNKLKCWGNNSSGQLGLGDTVNRPDPTEVRPDLDFVDVTLYAGTTCAVTAQTKQSYCWGSWGTAPGKLGTGATTNQSSLQFMSHRLQLVAGTNSLTSFLPFSGKWTVLSIQRLAMAPSEYKIFINGVDHPDSMSMITTPSGPQTVKLGDPTNSSGFAGLVKEFLVSTNDLLGNEPGFPVNRAQQYYLYAKDRYNPLILNPAEKIP